MPKVLFILTLIFSAVAGFAQCPIHPWIEANYERDAKFLLLRDILENPADPDYDHPIIDETRLTSYLEKLSAIYENPNSHASIDSLFQEFQIHANPESAPSKQIEFAVDNATPWLEDFKNTGISGVPELDDLMAVYQFSISEYIVLTNFTGFYIETGYDFLNVSALVDDFEAVPDVFFVGTYVPIVERFNYVGIPYELEPGEFVEVCDIQKNGDVFTFGIYAGDCPAGCLLSKTWDIQVTEDCQVTVLSTFQNDLENIAIVPNPARDKICLKNLPSKITSLQIFSIQGKSIQKFNTISAEIDVSVLKAGIYFVELNTSDGQRQVQKFVKM